MLNNSSVVAAACFSLLCSGGGNGVGDFIPVASLYCSSVTIFFRLEHLQNWTMAWWMEPMHSATGQAGCKPPKSTHSLKHLI